MFRWLLLVSVLALGLAEKASPKAAEPEPQAAEAGPQAAESAYPLHPLLEERDRAREHGLRGREDHLPGTGVYREIHPSGHPLPRERIEEQDRIVYDRFSPNYAQPTWVLDYRYLKSGGREYVRGDGGQILILPKGVKAPAEYKERGNYDELLEFLRLQELAEKEKLRLERDRHNRHEGRHEDREYNIRGHREREHHSERVGWQREVEGEHRVGGRKHDERHPYDRVDGGRKDDRHGVRDEKDKLDELLRDLELNRRDQGLRGRERDHHDIRDPWEH